MTLIEIPALGCDAGLYQPFNAYLPKGVEAQVLVTTQDRMEKCVADILARAPQDFVLFGTSFGARVAMEVAVAAPDRVRGLIISGSGPGPVADQAGGLKRSARVRGGEFEGVLKEMGDIISHLPGPRGPEAMEAFRTMSRKMGTENFARQSDALAHRADLWPRMSEIKCPVLCLWGEHDQYAGPDVGRKIATSVQRGSFEQVKDCGHFPTLEYPAESAALVTAWLATSSL
jgi:pimeloyl-ACP methyl ester carboxylesterase